MQVTKREILISIIIFLILICIGFFISELIENAVIEDNEKYYKALKINNDENMFNYAIKTNIGYALIQGKIEAIDGVSFEGVEGKYFKIRKVEEHYTMHTRQVAHTRKVGNTTTTYYTTEIYYSWDFVDEEEKHIEKFKFLGVEFKYDTIKFTNEKYLKTEKISSDKRYKYYAIPATFEGTLFTYINKNTINENKFYINNTIENLIKEKDNSIRNMNILFWFIWTCIMIAAIIGYISLENKYLE